MSLSKERMEWIEEINKELLRLSAEEIETTNIVAEIVSALESLEFRVTTMEDILVNHLEKDHW